MIPSSLLRCRCGAHFPWADPMSEQEYLEWVEEDERRTRIRKQLIYLFLVTLLGVTAPLTGTIAGVQSYRYRHVLVGEIGTYLALGYGAGLIGLVYSLVFILLYFGM